MGELTCVEEELPEGDLAVVIVDGEVVVGVVLWCLRWCTTFFGVVAVVVVAAAAVGVVLVFELLEPQPATTSAAAKVNNIIRFISWTPLWTLEEFDRRDGTPPGFVHSPTAVALPRPCGTLS